MSGGTPHPGGGLGDLFAKLQAAQTDLEEQVSEIDAAVVEGSAAGGAVVITLNGALEAEAVHIDAGIIDPADPALLEDAVLAALRDALGQVSELRSSLQSPVGTSFGGDVDLNALVGNLDLGGLLGGLDMSGLMGTLGMGPDPEAGDSSETDDEPGA